MLHGFIVYSCRCDMTIHLDVTDDSGRQTNGGPLTPPSRRSRRSEVEMVEVSVLSESVLNCHSAHAQKCLPLHQVWWGLTAPCRPKK